jgi:putative SOS response-associated peptidase YedK
LIFYRCFVPATSFCEYEDTKPRKTPTWFALAEDRPLFAFAGLWASWGGVRGPKAASVEFDQWLGADIGEALALQRPLPDKALSIVVKGEKEDRSPEFAS